MFIHCFKTILVFQWILQSCDGVLVSKENSQVAIQSDKKVDLPISPASLNNFLQVFLSLFLCFYFHLFHLVCCIRPPVQVVSLSDRRLKRNIRPLQKALPKAGRPEVGPGILGSKILPLPEIWFKGKWAGFIQLIETVVYVNRPCKQKVFLLVWNQHLHHRSLTVRPWKMMPGRLIRFPFGGFCRPIFRSC